MRALLTSISIIGLLAACGSQESVSKTSQAADTPAKQSGRQEVSAVAALPPAPAPAALRLVSLADKSPGMVYARTAVVEATIQTIQHGVLDNKMSCLNVINAYIERIETYDKATINAITYKNYDKARERAQEVDDLWAAQGVMPVMFCVPGLFKDNMDVKGFPTTAGSKMLMENYPPDDAKSVAGLKKHGVIVLAKTNMAEWAFSPRRTKSTSAGITKNAYNLEHVPAGSSGGTASAVAASFALVGFGTDTGNSVRGPSSHLSLVGMRSTHGLKSLDGIVPLVLSADVIGPMTRTVKDNAMMLQYMSLRDEGDISYISSIYTNSPKGMRVGVIRELSENIDPEVSEFYEAALKDLKAAGVIVVDNVKIKDVKAHIDASWGCKSFRKDVHEYLTQAGMSPKIVDPYQAFDAGVYADYTKGAWGYFKDGTRTQAIKSDGSVCGDLAKSTMRQGIKRDILAAMKRDNLDAFVYPSWTYPAAKLSRAEEDYKGDNSQTLAPPTGLPAITVPMGFVSGDLPVGLQILGKDNGETSLYVLAHAFEQKATHRRAPSGFGVIGK